MPTITFLIDRRHGRRGHIWPYLYQKEKQNQNIMATLKTIPTSNWATDTNAQHITLKDRFNAFADGQKSRQTLWFMVSLIFMGVMILPVPAVLMYYFNAPIAVLGVTMVCFFANIIANMGGEGIRTTILFFGASVLIHLVMILAFII